MSNFSDNYIKSESELIAEREAALARVKDIPDPRNEYIGTYTINGHNLTDHVMAYSVNEAEETIRQQLSLVGWFPRDLVVRPVKDNNVVIK